MDEQYNGKIYKIENEVNHKVYIGQTILDSVLKDRYHGTLLNSHNNHLRSSVLKYGEDNFSICILDYAVNREDLEEKERYYIKLYNSTDSKYGYNIDIGGHGGVVSDEGRKKISETSKKYWNEHPEERIKRSEKNKGTNNFLIKLGGHSEKDREKMREIRLKMIEEGKIDMHKALIASYNPESRRKMKESKSKCWYIQYDLEMNELCRWHTLKDMYDNIKDQGWDIHYHSYGSFKLKISQKKIFCEDLYKEYGYYFKRIEKEKYVNTEETN